MINSVRISDVKAESGSKITGCIDSLQRFMATQHAALPGFRGEVVRCVKEAQEVQASQNDAVRSHGLVVAEPVVLEALMKSIYDAVEWEGA